MASCQTNQLETVKLLIKAGALINDKDGNGNTSLKYAAHAGHSSIVDYLLSKHADTNIKSNDGKSAEDVAKNENIRAKLQHHQARH